MKMLICRNYSVAITIFSYMNTAIKKEKRDVVVTRFDKDGKNPVLVVDYTGEVVMKPVAPVQ